MHSMLEKFRLGADYRVNEMVIIYKCNLIISSSYGIMEYISVKDKEHTCILGKLKYTSPPDS